jgi:hypothetical protein
MIIPTEGQRLKVTTGKRFRVMLSSVEQCIVNHQTTLLLYNFCFINFQLCVRKQDGGYNNCGKMK